MTKWSKIIENNREKLFRAAVIADYEAFQNRRIETYIMIDKDGKILIDKKPVGWDICPTIMHDDDIKVVEVISYASCEIPVEDYSYDIDAIERTFNREVGRIIEEEKQIEEEKIDE